MRKAIVDLDELPGLFREAIRAALDETGTMISVRPLYGEVEALAASADLVESTLDVLARECARVAGLELDRATACERVFDVLRGHALFDGAEIEDTIAMADECVGTMLEERKPTQEH